jgi:exopolysaccharide production protein ExoQ
MGALTLSMRREEANSGARPLVFPAVVGFFFAFRIGLTFVFFQATPVLGSTVSIGIDLALLFGAILYSAKAQRIAASRLRATTPVRWVLALIAFALFSLLWTGAQSVAAAAAYWAGMAADVVIILLLLRETDAERYTRALMKGTVWGALIVALVAWCSPVTVELRLGNDVFLHPNTLGMETGIAALIAQYLAQRSDPRWKWPAIALAMTLLRTLSKTSIVAFAVAETWYLLRNSDMSRTAKRRIAIAALLMIAGFWGVATSYFEIYNNTGLGDQAETLTGRTFIWASALQIGMEKPWLGHGIYSFRSLMPAFGDFVAMHAHNEWIQLFFEFGVAGVAMAAGVYASFYRQSRRAPASELKMLALALLIFALLHGLTDTVPLGLSFPLWLMAALSICLERRASARAVIA